MYNFCIYHYADEIQIRTYSRTINKEEDEHERVEEKSAEEAESSQKEDTEKEDIDRDRSILSSQNRTKQAVIGIARANRWEYFITLTIDPKKLDRTDLQLVSRKFTQWMNNLKKRKAPGLKYLIVPELHADGKSYHLHGLIAGTDGLIFKDSKHKDKSGNIIYNLESWSYGFTTATKVTDTRRVSGYISKYITKELCTEKGKRRYWASKNCLKLDDVKEEFTLTKEEMEEFIADLYAQGRIKYQKSVEIRDCKQIICYYEVKNN